MGLKPRGRGALYLAVLQAPLQAGVEKGLQNGIVHVGVLQPMPGLCESPPGDVDPDQGVGGHLLPRQRG